MQQIGWQCRYRLFNGEWCDWYAVDAEAAQSRLAQNNEAFEVRAIYAGEPDKPAYSDELADAISHEMLFGKHDSIKGRPVEAMRTIVKNALEKLR